MMSEMKSKVTVIPAYADSSCAKPADAFEAAEVAELHPAALRDATTALHQSPWIRAARLPELLCSWDLAYRCTRSGWLKPIIQGKRRTIYRLADVLACMRRMESGEFPSARPKTSPR